MKTMGIAPAALLKGLADAFSYPRNGLSETLGTLAALDADAVGPFSDRVAGVVAAAAEFEDRTAGQLAYTRLFIGSFKMEAPPYASYYLEEGHTLNGRAAVEVAEVYGAFGIELDAREFAPADHLRYLLSFLHLVAARFEETGEEAFAEVYADFRDEYLLTWVDDFKELVVRYAEDGYYPALVALIVDVLRT